MPTWGAGGNATGQATLVPSLYRALLHRCAGLTYTGRDYSAARSLTFTAAALVSSTATLY